MNMKTQHKITFILFGLILLLIAVLLSCVDVPTKGPTPLPAKAVYRFIHAATDMGDVAISVDGEQKGNFSYRGVVDYQEYDAGKKFIKLSNGDTCSASLSTETIGTVVLLDTLQSVTKGVRDTTRMTYTLVERYYHAPANAAAIRVANLIHRGPAIKFKAIGQDSTVIWTEAVVNSATSKYVGVPPGDYKIIGIVDPDTVINYTINIENSRTTALIFGTMTKRDVLTTIDYK